MAKETYRPDARVRKGPESDENSPKIDNDEKLIEVKKKDGGKTKYHEEPADEQMYKSFEEIRKQDKGETDNL